MLYRIKDKTGLVIGVHECRPVDIKGYLSTLPRQSSPYVPSALPPVEHTFRDSVNNALESWTVLRGVAIGLSIAAPAYIYIVLHLTGVL